MGRKKALKYLLSAGFALDYSLNKRPEVNHRVGQCLQPIMAKAYPLKANQHTAELVLPSKHTFNCAKALIIDVFVKLWLSTSGAFGFTISFVLGALFFCNPPIFRSSYL